MRAILSNLIVMVLILGGALSVFSVLDSTAQAQGRGQRPMSPPEPPAALLDTSLTPGTLKVLVVDRTLDKPVRGVAVTTQHGGSNLRQLSNADGEVVFKELDKTQTIQVSAIVAGKLVHSEKFSLSDTKGVRVVFGLPDPAVARGGRPSSRGMSGIARPEQNDKSGTLTVRSILGELGGLTSSIPEGTPIHLVGIGADGTLNVQSKLVKEGNAGRVSFEKLVRNNSIAYYAMALMAREGGVDRLMTQVLRLPPQIGSRLLFAGRNKDSAHPGVDDLASIIGTGEAMPDAGVVKVRLYAEASQYKLLAKSSEVELIQIGSKDSPLTATVNEIAMTADSIRAQSSPMKILPETQPGQVSFYAVRLETKEGLAGVEVKIVRADNGEVVETSTKGEAKRFTKADGSVYWDALDVGIAYVAVASFRGKEVRSEAFTLSEKEAQSFVFSFDWPEQKVREAMFSQVKTGADKVYIAKVIIGERTFLSLPFQMPKNKGAIAGIYMYPELLFQVRGGADLDDQRLWFNVRFSLANMGVAPIQSSSGRGFYVPLPKGFIGASVADEMASRVGVESGKGFLWRGYFPPGSRDFIANFALPVEAGHSRFDMSFPYGVNSGQLALPNMPGMELLTPPGMKVESLNMPNGKEYLMLPDLNLEAGSSLVFAIENLPQHSAWARRFRIAVGLLAILLVLWTLWVILFSRGTGREDMKLEKLEESREILLQKRVDLEQSYQQKKIETKDYEGERDKLNTQLTSAYRKIDEHKSKEASLD